MLELVISHTTATDNWIKRHHYLHGTPAGAVIRMEFWISMQETAELCTEAELSGEKCLVGAMLWGWPVSPKIDQKHILELTRCCFLDVMPWLLSCQSQGMDTQAQTGNQRSHRVCINGGTPQRDNLPCG